MLCGRGGCARHVRACLRAQLKSAACAQMCTLLALACKHAWPRPCGVTDPAFPPLRLMRGRYARLTGAPPPTPLPRQGLPAAAATGLGCAPAPCLPAQEQGGCCWTTRACLPWLPGPAGHGCLGQLAMVAWASWPRMPGPAGHGCLGLLDMVAWASWPRMPRPACSQYLGLQMRCQPRGTRQRPLY